MDTSSRKSRVLIGASGSVAAIKIPELVQQLCDTGFEVKVVATKPALHFSPKINCPVKVYTDEDEWSCWQQRGDPVLHIDLRNWADLFLLAPLSANTLAKLACGLSDNLLTCVARAWWFGRTGESNGTVTKPVLFAPSMNVLMWQHPFTQEHIDRLVTTLGWIYIPTTKKVQMCGEVGEGAMAEVATIVTAVVQKLPPQMHNYCSVAL